MVETGIISAGLELQQCQHAVAEYQPLEIDNDDTDEDDPPVK